MIANRNESNCYAASTSGDGLEGAYYAAAQSIMLPGECFADTLRCPKHHLYGILAKRYRRSNRELAVLSMLPLIISRALEKAPPPGCAYLKKKIRNYYRAHVDSCPYLRIIVNSLIPWNSISQNIKSVLLCFAFMSAHAGLNSDTL